MIFYGIEPCDTLFFKGAEPMEAGESHYAKTLFPPPASVLEGAVRTAWLVQHNIPFSGYRGGRYPEADKVIGPAGHTPPFTVLGPLLEKEGTLLAPWPAHWYLLTDKLPQEPKPQHPMRLIRASAPDSGAAAALGLRSHVPTLPWMRFGEAAVQPENAWIALAALAKDAVAAGVDFFMSAWLYKTENRTGIALERINGKSLRTVKEGHLYSGRHIRLARGVRMVFGIDRDVGLAASGVITLGGEQRFGRYERIAGTGLGAAKGNLWLAISPVHAAQVPADAVFAAYKPQYSGGWDFVQWFHKPMTAWYPAGSVFTKQINNAMISIN